MQLERSLLTALNTSAAVQVAFYRCASLWGCNHYKKSV